MGKRSDFKRRRRDTYDTPVAACLPLAQVVPAGARFVDPCGGSGALIDGMRHAGLFCAGAMDVMPRRSDIMWGDALSGADLRRLCARADFIVTNPPWQRALLHPMIAAFAALRPTWLLFDADWKHTKQARDLMTRCHTILSVGRVKWIAGSGGAGKDNACWYGFGEPRVSPPHFLTGGD